MVRCGHHHQAAHVRARLERAPGAQLLPAGQHYCESQRLRAHTCALPVKVFGVNSNSRSRAIPSHARPWDDCRDFPACMSCQEHHQLQLKKHKPQCSACCPINHENEHKAAPVHYRPLQKRTVVLEMRMGRREQRQTHDAHVRLHQLARSGRWPTVTWLEAAAAASSACMRAAAASSTAGTKGGLASKLPCSAPWRKKLPALPNGPSTSCAG